MIKGRVGFRACPLLWSTTGLRNGVEADPVPATRSHRRGVDRLVCRGGDRGRHGGCGRCWGQCRAQGHVRGGDTGLRVDWPAVTRSGQGRATSQKAQCDKGTGTGCRCEEFYCFFHGCWRFHFLYCFSVPKTPTPSGAVGPPGSQPGLFVPRLRNQDYGRAEDHRRGTVHRRRGRHRWRRPVLPPLRCPWRTALPLWRGVQVRTAPFLLLIQGLRHRSDAHVPDPSAGG